MSVIVKGMKMPKNCLHCDFDNSYGICACRNETPYVCEYSAKQRPSWCPLEEVPSAQPETHEKRTETHGVCLDAISRQAAIEVLGVFTQTDVLGHTPKQIVEALPSTQPEQTNSWCINSWCIDCKEYDTESKCCHRYNRVIKQTLDEVYAHAETEAEARFHAQQRWIPCSERLPEKPEQVLIYAWNVHYVLAKYKEIRTWEGIYKMAWVVEDAYNAPHEIKHDVIAWMPLLEPYREG